MRTPWLASLLILTACGGDRSANAPAGQVPALRIVNYTYLPQRLEVTPGTTIVILNEDQVQHSVTSTSTAGVFTYGTVNGLGFDTGPFTGTWTIAIPPTTPVGTVVPYFCELHAGAMLNQGEIAVVAP